MENIDTDDCDSNCFYRERAGKPEGAGDPVFDHTASRCNPSTAVHPEGKARKRDILNGAVDAYLAAGGKVTKWPPGRRPTFRFGVPRPPAGSVGTSRSNGLGRPRWRDPVLSPGEQRDLLRQARTGDERAKDRLFKSFHRKVLKIAAEYSGPTHVELVAAGIEGFCHAVANFDLRWSNGIDAYASECIKGYILEHIKEWRRNGIKSDTRADRHLFSNPGATAEDVVDAIGGKLKAAQEAIDRAGAWESYDTTEGHYDENNPRSNGLDVSADMQRKYSACDKYSMSPQLRFATHSDRTTPAEENTLRWSRLRQPDNKKIDLRRRAVIAARCSQYPECGRSSELWSWHRYSDDIRSAAESRRCQQNNWGLEPNFSDDRDYKLERMKHDRESTKAISRSSTAEDAGSNRESGESRLQQRERFRSQSYSV